MPVRLLSSSVLRWPRRDDVLRALHHWVGRVMRADERVLRVGYTGSLAAGEWGFGSDIDLIVILNTAQEAWLERARCFDATDLPVPVDLLVYTEAEWEEMSRQGRGPRPVVWIDETGS